MNQIMINQVKIEFETSELTLDELCSKYNCTTKDLKGSNRWKKNLLKPKTKYEKKAHLNTHIDIVASADEIVTNNDLLVGPDPDPESLMDAKITHELTDELRTELILKASQDMIAGEQPQLPKDMKDGFDGLRRLDTTLQDQAQKLIKRVDTALDAIDDTDTKSLRDLAAIHTGIRDSYFNSKNTMVSIINGGVTQNNNQINNLVTFLAGVESDC